MDIVLLIVLWFIGNVIGSLGVVQILLVGFFSIPFTKTLNRLDLVLNYNSIISRSYFTIMFWLIIISITTFLVLSFLNTLPIIGYFIGLFQVTLMSLGKLKRNRDNIEDYLIAYRYDIKIDEVTRFVDDGLI